MEELDFPIARWQRGAFKIGALGALIGLFGAWSGRQQFLISYLFGYLFWFGIAAGCLGILLVHHVTGGAWGELIKPQLEAASLTLPLWGLFFIPVLLELQSLYPWARPDVLSIDPLLRTKHAYLNIPFFSLRAALYFILWSVMAYCLSRWSAAGGQAGAQKAARRSAPGLILFALTLTFAVVDWMMSLEPHWYSSIYAVMVIIGQMLAAFGFTIIGLRLMQGRRDRENPIFVKPYHDLGNMLLAFVMFWAYMSFSQYLIIWSANSPEETSWYLHRQAGGWFWVAMFLVFFQFTFPFLALLGRVNKRRLDRLAWVAALIFAVGAVNTFWLVEPAFFSPRFHAHWMDVAALAGLGGFWLAAFFHQLKKRPSRIGSYAPEETE